MAVLAPKCIGDLKSIDADLGKVAGAFWKHVWNNPNNTIPKPYKYLMAFCAAMGSNRDHQSARELTKAFGEGASLAEITEAMEMMVWNMGIPYFSCDSEISQTLEVYNKIKTDHQQGVPFQDTLAYIKANIIHRPR